MKAILTKAEELTFRSFMEDNRKIISMDFDGVLHTSLVPGTTHPLDYWDWESWVPNERMHRQLRQDAQSANIVVVSKRDDIHQEPMWEFIHHYNLPVQQIYTTSNRPKLPVLLRLGVIKHYDDDKNLARELAGTGIEFVYVDPRQSS